MQHALIQVKNSLSDAFFFFLIFQLQLLNVSILNKMYCITGSNVNTGLEGRFWFIRLRPLLLLACHNTTHSVSYLLLFNQWNNTSTLPSAVINQELGASSFSFESGGRVNFNKNWIVWPGATVSEGSWTFGADLGSFGRFVTLSFCAGRLSGTSHTSGFRIGNCQ